MIKIYLICILIFLGIWAAGAFLAYIVGIDKVSFQGAQINQTGGMELRQKQEEITFESKQAAERLMDRYDAQMKRFRQLEGQDPSRRF